MTIPRHAPFPGVIAHHHPPGQMGDHERAFRHATFVDGEPASRYFHTAGVAACAEHNGGLCSFYMGRAVALYQATNTPLAGDEVLGPSLDSNRDLFGDFVGALAIDDPARPAKRHAIERSLGSAKFVDGLEPALRAATRRYLAAVSGELPLDDFARALAAYTDSVIPGVLDLTQRPLTEFLASRAHGRVARDFFEIASEVISKVHPEAVNDADAIVPFVRALLADNCEAIAAAPDTNLIKRQCALWGLAFSRAAIARLSVAQLKELGTIIVATYDTTALSLLWAIAYIEADPEVKRVVVAAARAPAAQASPSILELVVLEAVRLAGSNPTALWRRVIKPFSLRRGDREVTVPAGTMLWLDRRRANQDASVFPRPEAFDLANVRAIVRPRDTLGSLLSRGRYEINSFSMVNTERNPRKCPGRLFSVRQQAIFLEELYAGCDVTVRGVELALARHASMPRPAKPGTIRVTARACPHAPTGATP